MAATKRRLQDLLDRAVDEKEKKGLTLNFKKTKIWLSVSEKAKDVLLRIEIKKRMLVCYAISVLAYGSEYWTLSPRMSKNKRQEKYGSTETIVKTPRTE